MTVDEALALYPADPLGEYGGRSWIESSDAATMLAAEVRRLREQLEQVHEAVRESDRRGDLGFELRARIREVLL